MKLSNSYLALGDQFYVKSLPTQASDPKLLLWNGALAKSLEMENWAKSNEAQLAAFFCGNRLLEGSDPMALAYAGHQFGNFVPQLGDGRAHYLGDLEASDKKLYELQLKGSGRTGFSRGGDGLCGLGPAIREFIMSEAMHALGIPTARSLAVVTTGDTIYRDRAVPGAVVTRVSASHIRIGSFQYFAARGDYSSVRLLADFAISKHYQDIQNLEGRERYLAFYQAVFDRLINLIVEWMRVGFIHGVMNTDNTMISGETLDYGPCAMMGIYNPLTVYSSIDARGRYAFANQAPILRWNLARLAECLLPLIDEDTDQAIKAVEPIIGSFQEQYALQFRTMMAAKIGMPKENINLDDNIGGLLKRLEENKLDYTETFFQLRQSLSDESEKKALQVKLGDWYQHWRSQLELEGEEQNALQRMSIANPVVIPRNHHVERLIAHAENTGDVSEVNDYVNVLSNPYSYDRSKEKYMDKPVDGDSHYRTFCGT